MSSLPYPLLFSDIDGTLINNEHLLDPITLKAINNYRQAGGLFSLATGRNYTQADALIHQLQIDIPVVLCDGAMVYDPLTDTESVFMRFSQQQIEHIVASCEELGPRIYPYFSCFHSTTFQHKFYGIKDHPAIRQLVKQWYIDLSIIPSLEELSDDVKVINMIIFIEDPEKETDFQNWCKNHHHSYHSIFYSESFVEIAPKEATKGHGIHKVSQQLHLEKNQVAAIGDHLNDMPMFSSVGLLAAMDNAVDQLKELAHVIVPSNDKNGLAHFIHHHLLPFKNI